MKQNEPRRGVVLGAGGVLGAAWLMAALTVVEKQAGFDANKVEALIGTSAGSIVAAFLGCGVSAEQMANHQRGIVVEGDPQLDYDYDTDGGSGAPPRPRMRIGSPKLLRRGVLSPRHVSPLAALSALAPQGRGTLAPVGALVDLVAPPEWPTDPKTYIVAMDYQTGRRTVFGSPGAPDAKLSDAVRASCSIPGWYESVMIGGRPYVDGGTRSSTSAEKLRPLQLDEVYILAPMSALSFDRPTQVIGKLERRVRVAIRRQIDREADLLRADGTRVVVLAPTAEDLAVFGVNMMDPRRRERTFETAIRTTGDSLARAEELADHPQGLAQAG